jgi:hypothetical protein
MGSIGVILCILELSFASDSGHPSADSTGGNMRVNLGRVLFGFFLAITIAASAWGAAPPQEALVGSGAPPFSLAAADGRLVDYRDDFYGRHHLILTFYPAAFTPV